MPKQVYRINRFDGGLVSAKASTDLEGNEFQLFDGVCNDIQGQLRTGGAFDASGNVSVRTITYPGYGIHAFNVDYQIHNNNEAPDTCIAFARGKAIDVYSSASNTWTASQIIFSASVKPVYTYSDGVLRVSDANFGSTAPRMLKYISASYFKATATGAGTLLKSGWDEYGCKCTNPVSVAFSTASATTTPTNIYSLHVTASEVAGEGEGWDKEWECGVTYIYDDNQESLILKSTSTVTGILADSGVTLKLFLRDFGWDYRITAVNIYLREVGTDEWLLQATAKTTDGIFQWNSDNANNYWVDNSPASYGVSISSGLITTPYDYETYLGRTGYVKDDKSIGFFGSANQGYGVACIANRRMFIGNIRNRSFESGNTKIYTDRIMYTPVNKLDIFPLTNYIDIGFNDGQKVTAIASYADRLFVFKENILFIVNVQGGMDTQWYVEARYANYGVRNACNVYQSDIGILWANNIGLFYFDGSNIKNLIQGKLDNIIWNKFVSDTTIVGYDSIAKKAFVIIDAGGLLSDNGDAYIYNFLTNSFIYSSDFTTSSNKTNFISGVYGNLIIAQETAESINTTIVKIKDKPIEER